MTDKSAAAIEKLAYKHAEPKVGYNSYGEPDISPDVDKINAMIADLTALIEEHYVSKKAYNVIKEHYQSALAAKDINRDYINKYYYPKEFVEWKDKKELRYSSLHNRYYSDTDNGMREFTLDELFNYWKENEQEEHPTNKEKFDGNYLPDPD